MARITREKTKERDYEDRSYDRGGDDYGKDGDDRKKSFGRRKQCRFSADQDYVIDYKDVEMMLTLISEHGKIVPRRISGTAARYQRELTKHVKRARHLALMPFVAQG